MAYKTYYCFACGTKMIQDDQSLCCCNCGRTWRSRYLDANNGISLGEDEDESSEYFANDYCETDGYDDEWGYYNIHGEMPPPGWGDSIKFYQNL